jgi:hypothetical protein
VKAKPLNRYEALAVAKSLAPGMKRNGLGRPSCWNPVLAERIVQLTASGYSMAKACAECDLQPGTVYRWLATHVELRENSTQAEIEDARAFAAFREGIVRAREARADSRLDTIDGIMERLTNRELPADQRLDAATARAAVEGYRTLMELESPMRYGKALTLKGSKEQPLQHVSRHELSDEELQAIAAGGLKNAT